MKAILLILPLCLLAGCASVSVRERAPSNPPPPAAQTDNRSLEEIRAENVQLRARLAEQERNLQGWERTVNDKKALVDQAKRQREDVKKDRDRWKKLAQGD